MVPVVFFQVDDELGVLPAEELAVFQLVRVSELPPKVVAIIFDVLSSFAEINAT